MLFLLTINPTHNHYYKESKAEHEPYHGEMACARIIELIFLGLLARSFQVFSY
jgi:hypothetical protein